MIETVKESRETVVAALAATGIKESVLVGVRSWDHRNDFNQDHNVEVECSVWLAKQEKRFEAPTLQVAVDMALAHINGDTVGENVEVGEEPLLTAAC